MIRSVFLTAIALFSLAACNPQQQGELDLQITDAAVNNAVNVFLSINGVTVKGPDGQQSFEFLNDDDEPEPLQVDLLSLTGDDAEDLVDDWTLTAGAYQWIQLDIATEELGDSYVVLDDTSEHEITIPSGTLKLVRGFNIPANGEADITLDVDLYKGLVLANGQYKLKPVIRLIDNSTAGHIGGVVSETLMAACNDSAAVYAFAGTDTDADDVFGETGPELVAWVEYDDDEAEYRYELGFLTAGVYTLHLACEPNDDPELDDDFSDFSNAQNVSVIADDMIEADFN